MTRHAALWVASALALLASVNSESVNLEWQPDFQQHLTLKQTEVKQLKEEIKSIKTLMQNEISELREDIRKFMGQSASVKVSDDPRTIDQKVDIVREVFKSGPKLNHLFAENRAFLATIDNHEYLLTQDLMFREDAVAFCLENGMRQVSIQTEEKWNAIFGYLKYIGESYKYWTSGRFLDGRWRWEATNEPMVFRNNLDAESDADTNCIYFNYNNWVKIKCDMSHDPDVAKEQLNRVICE